MGCSARALPTGPHVPKQDGQAIGVRGARSGVAKYPEFPQRTLAAGCVGYIVWIAGRHVQYFGRRGEVHVEHFPAT